MRSTTLIVPGLHGSGPAHWQSWFETEIGNARRVEQDDWSQAALGFWSDRVGEMIDRAVGKVWLVAHSFGCLATVVAAAGRADRVAGALLVAPANPERFGPDGLHAEPGTSTSSGDSGKASITAHIPHGELGFPSIVVASVNDPWMRLTAASVWADRWGSQFECIGRAGHINVDSGFGPWPQGLELFRRFCAAQGDEPLGEIDAPDVPGSRRSPPDRSTRLADQDLQPDHRRERYADRRLSQQWFG